MTKYRKKPVIVDAMQWTGHNFDECLEFCDTGCIQRVGSTTSRDLIITTLSGEMIVCEGSWIIKGTAGELYRCKSDMFEQAYEKVTA